MEADRAVSTWLARNSCCTAQLRIRSRRARPWSTLYTLYFISCLENNKIKLLRCCDAASLCCSSVCARFPHLGQPNKRGTPVRPNVSTKIPATKALHHILLLYTPSLYSSTKKQIKQ